MLKRKYTKPNQLPHKKSKSTPHKQLTLTEIFCVAEPPLKAAPLEPKSFSFYPHIFQKLFRLLKAATTRVTGHRRKGTCKAFFIRGGEGSGKTFLVRSVIQTLGAQSLELGVDSLRSGPMLRKVFVEATQSFAVGLSTNKVQVVFIDDVDLVLPPDTGFTKALAELVADTKTPIVLAGSSVPSCLEEAVKILKLEKDEERLMEYFKQFGGDTSQLRALVSQTQGNLNKLFGQFTLPQVSLPPAETVQIDDLQAYVSLTELLVATDKKPQCSLCETYNTASLTEFITARVSDELLFTPLCVAREETLSTYVCR